MSATPIITRDNIYELFWLQYEEEKKAKQATPITITRENIYDYLVIEEWEQDEDEDDKNGFSYTENYDLLLRDETSEILHEKMFNEIHLNYNNFTAERSCMWVEEVKRRANWVKGETLYGYSREKHLTYPIWWSRDEKDIGHSTWILEADGYVAFSFRNGYTSNETVNTKHHHYIRPDCLYNDKNCDKIN